MLTSTVNDNNNVNLFQGVDSNRVYKRNGRAVEDDIADVATLSTTYLNVKLFFLLYRIWILNLFQITICSRQEIYQTYTYFW